ncbi:MAG: hypothetical protein ABI439_14635 [Rhodospirillales bacterium]
MARRVQSFFIRHWVFSGLILAGLAVATAALVFPAEARHMVAERWQGQFGGGRIESAEVIRTQDQWQQLWQRLDRKPPGRLHVGQQIAVFVAAGEKPDTAYRLRLVSTALRDDRLMVVWEVTVADPVQISNTVSASAQIVAQPWLVVLFDRADLAPVIEQRVR